MVKLQYLTLATAIAILGSGSISVKDSDASVTSNQVNLIQSNTTKAPFILRIAQNSLQSDKTSKTGDEMIDALQKRQDKIEGLKEFKILKDKDNREKIDKLEKENINLADAEELKQLEEIINNENLNSEEILKALEKEKINIKSIEKLHKIQTIINLGKSKSNAFQSDDSGKLPATTAFRLLTIGIPATILVFLIATPFVKGTFGVFKSNYQKKFGKPPIPERSLTLHNEAFKEISSIGRKADSLNDNKFGNEEFKILIHFKVELSKNTEGYKELNYKVELLRAAIIAQKSFLKLESTELRYRSRRQQEFYQHIADNLEDNLDKEAFAKKIKKKQAEILPLINTEEGREAIHSYSREINEISKYELGLKLLSLFKKYDLKDFSIIRDISQIVEGLQGSDLLEPKRLVLTVKEYYDVFEKIAPVLEISKEESTPATYARILQIVGLVHRHGDSYGKFKELIRLLHKWEKPNETIEMVREQYSDREYSIPPEFKKEIPGVNTYHQYAEYLENLS